MNQTQLLELLTNIKTQVGIIGEMLTATADKLTEATDEILAKLEDLKNFDVSPEVAAIIDQLATATNNVVNETTALSTQATNLADIVPNVPDDPDAPPQE